MDSCSFRGARFKYTELIKIIDAQFFIYFYVLVVMISCHGIGYTKNPK